MKAEFQGSSILSYQVYDLTIDSNDMTMKVEGEDISISYSISDNEDMRLFLRTFGIIEESPRDMLIKSYILKHIHDIDKDFLVDLCNEGYEISMSDITEDTDPNELIGLSLLFKYVDPRYEDIASTYEEVYCKLGALESSNARLYIKEDNWRTRIDNYVSNYREVSAVLIAVQSLIINISERFSLDPENVMVDAFSQVQEGKGAERHGTSEKFKDQRTWRIIMEEPGFSMGQARKKLLESERMEPDAEYRELLGALNYMLFDLMRLREEDN